MNQSTDGLTSRATTVGARRVPCPRCRVEAGEDCTTRTGNRSRNSHADRWGLYTQRMQSERFIVRVREDNPRLGVVAGEQYEAQVYWLDPQKCTLLRRVPDGHDPECNHYWHQVEWERWAS